MTKSEVSIYCTVTSSSNKDPELLKTKITDVKQLEVCQNVLFSDLQEIVLNSFRFEIERLTLFRMG